MTSRIVPLVLLGILIFAARPAAQQIGPGVNLSGIFQRMKEIEQQLPPGEKEEFRSRREEMQKNAKEMFEPLMVSTKMLLRLGHKPDRGSTEHEDNEDAQQGIEDTKHIFISGDLILKKYAPVEQDNPELSEEEVDQLQCDLAIATMLHEWKHATADQGAQSKNEDDWELCAFSEEKFWLTSVLANMPEYTQQPLFGSLESEIDGICRRIDELSGVN